MFTYLICSTPRVGSNLLCSLLNATRVVGHPREYLCPLQVKEHGPALIGSDTVTSAADLHRFLDAAAAAYGAHGRFGIKAHYHQLQGALQAGLDFEGRFPDRFVLVNRADLLGQALSFVRAAQTGAWISTKPELRQHTFQPELIRSTIQRLAAENYAWEVLFKKHDVEPYRLSYEQLCADFPGELTKLLTFLEVDLATVDIPRAVAAATSHFKPQRDGVTAEWRARYQDWVRQRAKLQRAVAPTRAEAVDAR